MHFSGTYSQQDVHILLKPALIPTVDVDAKEAMIQSGDKHYSEMISPETVPDERYMQLYSEALERNAGRLSRDVAKLAEILTHRPQTKETCVIISLARAGTPIGVLLKRQLERLGISVFHYSVSIIRGRGIDANALRYISERHDPKNCIFLDGWTGKGAIKGELERSLEGNKWGFDPFLAVIADPAGRADIAATDEDYVIPSGLLNGIVSGLISRSVLNDELVGKGDFHACLFQEEHAGHDVSNDFIEAVEKACWPSDPFKGWTPEAAKLAHSKCEALIQHIVAQYGIDDINRIKPGIAESTRAILRRVPEMVLLKDPEDPEVQHIIHLANATGVPIQTADLGNYRSVTIIKKLGREQE